MKIALIILNYNNLVDTQNCIESVLNFNSASVKYIVVDNASKKACRDSVGNFLAEKFSSMQIFGENEKIDSALPDCSYVLCEENNGYAQGNNEGLALAYQDDEIDYVMILNNDIVFIQDIIPPLINILNEDAKVGIVSPLLLKKDGNSIDYNCARKQTNVLQLFLEHSSLIYKFYFLKKIYDRKMVLKHIDKLSGIVEIELPSGSCMLMSKLFFKNIGSFDPNTFLYMEENILYEKILKTGRKNVLVLGLRAIHLGASTTKMTPSKHMLEYTKMSTIYFMRQYLRTNILAINLMKLLFYFRLKKNS